MIYLMDAFAKVKKRQVYARVALVLLHSKFSKYLQKLVISVSKGNNGKSLLTCCSKDNYLHRWITDKHLYIAP